MFKERKVIFRGLSSMPEPEVPGLSRRVQTPYKPKSKPEADNKAPYKPGEPSGFENDTKAPTPGALAIATIKSFSRQFMDEIVEKTEEGLSEAEAKALLGKRLGELDDALMVRGVVEGESGEFNSSGLPNGRAIAAYANARRDAETLIEDWYA
jgi:hypothetical protein